MTTETKPMTLVDLPLLRRLNGQGVVLDSEVGLLQDAYGAHSAYLSSILFNRGMYTLITRSDSQQALGQFRYRADDLNANIVYLASTHSATETDDTVWLHILDGMTREAGKHGAHALIAEVDTGNALFETMRAARFATYMRQTIWRHDPVHARELVPLTDECGNDQIGIMSLMCHTIPTLQQAVTAPHNEMDGLVYRVNGHVEAYIAYSEGKHGVYLLPFIHPNMLPHAADIIESALAHITRAQRIPIYVNVRSYQGWLADTMRDMEFTPIAEQAVMVRHIAAGIRTAFSRAKYKLETAHSVAPPHWSTAQTDED